MSYKHHELSQHGQLSPARALMRYLLFSDHHDRSMHCLTCWLIFNYCALIVESWHSRGQDGQLLSLIKLNTVCYAILEDLQSLPHELLQQAHLYVPLKVRPFLICLNKVTRCALLFTFFSCQRNSLFKLLNLVQSHQNEEPQVFVCHWWMWAFIMSSFQKEY